MNDNSVAYIRHKDPAALKTSYLVHVYYEIASVLVVYVPLPHVCVALLSQAWQLFLYFIAFMIMQNNVFLVHVHGFSMPSTMTSICSSSNVFLDVT